MEASLAGAGPWFQHFSAAAPLAFMRLLGAFLLLPLLPAQTPRHLRLAVPIAAWPLALVGLSGQASVTWPESMLAFSVLLVQELCVGLVLVLPAGVVFWAAQSAGELVDIKTGANNNATFGTGAGSPEGPAQILMTQLATLAFLAGGGLLEVIRAVFTSYRVIPIGSPGLFEPDKLLDVVNLVVGPLFSAVFLLFGPFFVVFLLVEFGLGLAAKFAQQLQISTITAPAKGLVLPLLLILLLGYWQWIGPVAGNSIAGLGQALRVLSGGR